MNCFTHALPYLDNPNFIIGTCLPDWMNVIDRKTRFRTHRVTSWLETNPSNDELQLFSGIRQHLHDDVWFHATPTFATLNSQFSREIKQFAPELNGMQTFFIGHILIEMLLDDELSRRFPGQLEFYYSQIQQVDGFWLQSAIERYANKSLATIPNFLNRFISVRFLFDYEFDSRLLFRLNQVMQRVQLQVIPDSVIPWFADARRVITNLTPQLLPNYPISLT